MKNNYAQWFDKYLKASYKYYITYEDTGMSDAEYDYLCRELLAAWDTFEHPLKHLVDTGLLKCGSGFSIQWPEGFKEEMANAD